MINLTAIRRHADTADIDHMRSTGEQRDHFAFVKGWRDNREIMQMTGALPRIVGDVDITVPHAVRREYIEEMHHRPGHGIDVPRRAGDRLGQHLAFQVKNPGGDIAGFAAGGTKRRAHQRLGLFLDHGEQPFPHHLIADLIHVRAHAAYPSPVDVLALVMTI